MAEIVELHRPGWLQDQLRAQVTRELQAEAGGTQLPIRQRVPVQTTYLEKSAKERNDDTD